MRHYAVKKEAESIDPDPEYCLLKAVDKIRANFKAEREALQRTKDELAVKVIQIKAS